MRRLFAGLISALLFSGCSVESAKSRYLLAEKLWLDGNHQAAVREFEKVVVKDPDGKLGLQALFRAAMTQAIFLDEYADAVEKFRRFIERSSDLNAVWEAQKQIGEILFSKTEQYDAAIQHYRGLVTQRPKDKEAPEFLFRIARSHFFLRQFDTAVTVYRDLSTRYPKSEWAEKAALEIGNTYFTRGGASTSRTSGVGEAYQDALDAYQDFLEKRPQSALAPEAQFGVASCLEAMDQLDQAYHAFEALQGHYPAPRVIEIKLIRIRERKEQRSR